MGGSKFRGQEGEKLKQYSCGKCFVPFGCVAKEVKSGDLVVGSYIR